ncbi:MAG TPA: glycosyltransferase family 4 protein [Candidatus Atribacteria bacterium]|nr:glycosyltransferase family 4 protein [Candidatus Atribacteria bacterium]
MMKKLMLIVPSLVKGGVERVVSNLSKGLSNYYQVYVIIYHQPIEYDIEGELINLETPTGSYYKKIINTFYRIIRLKRLIKKISPDFIVSFMGNLQPILTLAPIIVSVRNNPDFFTWQEKLFLITIYKLPNVKKIITCSIGIERKLSNHYHLQNVKNIYNPINFKLIGDKLLSQKPLKFEYILAAGRLHRQKGFDILINSFARSSFKNLIKLVILGEGEERKNLEELILKLDLKNQVLLLGAVDNPFIYMKHAKFFIFSSRYEGFGNILLEVLACETPVVATDCETGTSEIIEDRKNGLLVPPKDENALQSVMEELFYDQKLYERLKANTRKSVEKYRMENIMQDWISLFKEVYHS